MNPLAGKFGDLTARVLSALVMIAVGLVAIYYGGVLFQFVTALVCAVMAWELCRLINGAGTSLPMQAGILQFVSLMVAMQLPTFYVAPLLLAPVIAIASQAKQDRILLGVFLSAVTLAGYEIMYIRDDVGGLWLFWLVALVVVTDVAGYFFGRIIGGPKFWPALSPKKTWAGTGGGWLCAALIGAYLVQFEAAPWWMIPFSVSVAFCSQMGDLAESALKRRVGAKDASDLIPGHGGVTDRFDGMTGAAVYVFLMTNLFGISLVPA